MVFGLYLCLSFRHQFQFYHFIIFFCAIDWKLKTKPKKHPWSALDTENITQFFFSIFLSDFACGSSPITNINLQPVGFYTNKSIFVEFWCLWLNKIDKAPKNIRTQSSERKQLYSNRIRWEDFQFITNTSVRPHKIEIKFTIGENSGIISCNDCMSILSNPLYGWKRGFALKLIATQVGVRCKRAFSVGFPVQLHWLHYQCWRMEFCFGHNELLSIVIDDVMKVGWLSTTSFSCTQFFW